MAQSPTPNQNALIADGPIYALATTNSTAYIGGLFTHVGPYTGGGVIVDANSGNLLTYPPVNGWVYAAVSEPSGGFYVGGTFTQIGGANIPYLAHVLSNGTVDTTWNPAPGPYGNQYVNVHALALSGSTLYVGGNFTTMGSSTRQFAAALNVSGGGATLLPWDPEADSQVNTISVGGSAVFLGGYFANMNITTASQPRAGLAAVDPNTGTVLSWNPSLYGVIYVDAETVYASLLDGTTLYVGGSFTNVGGSAGPARNGLAAFDTTNINNINLTSWAPNPNDRTSAFAVSGSTLYVGGYFTTVEGSSYSLVAAFNQPTGSLLSWNPNLTSVAPGGGSVVSFVRSIIPSGTSIYLGGAFNTVGGQSYDNLVAVDAASGAPSSWNPSVNNAVWALALNGTNLYVGGVFSSVNGTVRNFAAAMDISSGALLPWDPNPDNQVSALSVNGSVVYAGGNFANIGGQARAGLAALDAATGVANSTWNPNPQGGSPVNITKAFAVVGSTVYIGGIFNSMGGQSRNGLAAVDAVSGAVSGWNPGLSKSGQSSPRVWSVLAAGTTIYVGGDFTSAGGQTRNSLAAFDATSASLLSWNPNATSGSYEGFVDAMALGPTVMYVGGSFTSLGGQTRNMLGAVDLNQGAATSWNPNLTLDPQDTYDSAVEALALNGSTLYIGGLFGTVQGNSFPNLAAVDTTTANALAWDPNPATGGIVFGLGVNGSTLTVAGEFATIANTNRSDFAQFSITAQAGAPVITASTATGTVGTAFSYQVQATNSPTLYTASNLPPGLSISTGTGLISGTPAIGDGGTYSVVLAAANGSGWGSAILSLTINGGIPSITVTNGGFATVGVPFSYQIQASNNPTSYGATGLPASGDLSVSTGTGLISGTPQSADVGTYNVTLSATNSYGTGTVNWKLVISSAPLGIPAITASTAAATVGVAFSYQIQATNSPTSYGATGLPSGLSINTGSGLISGTPTAAGQYSISLSATNSAGTGIATLTLTVVGSVSPPPAPGPPSVSPRVYPNPWRGDRDAGYPITFDQLTGNTTIKIFDLSGHLVNTLSTASVSTTWQRDNSSGVAVASGLYFYVVTNDQGQKVTGKLVIIK